MATMATTVTNTNNKRPMPGQEWTRTRPRRPSSCDVRQNVRPPVLTQTHPEARRLFGSEHHAVINDL